MGKRIVIDTNVLISALGWNGAERTLIRHCKERLFELVISPQVVDDTEYFTDYVK